MYLKRNRALLWLVPEFVAEVSAALSSVGRGDLAPQLEAGIIERCTYDLEIDAGYIYLVRPRPSWYFEKLAAPVAETLPFDGFNVDIDHDAHLFGIELLGRSEVFAKLRVADR